MSSLLLPRRFYNQPQGSVEIDWGNPVTAGLVSCFIPATSGFYDVISAYLVNAQCFGNYATEAGMAIGKFDSSTVPGLPGYFQRSVFSRVFVASSGGTNTMLSESGTGTNNARLQLTSTSIALDRAASVNYVNCTTPSGIFGACVVSGSSRQTIHTNGQLRAERTGSTSYTHSGTGYLLRTTSGQLPNVLLHAEYDRGLSDMEAASLSANPWQIFKVSE